MTPQQLLQISLNQKAFPQYIYKYRADNINTERIFTHNELWFSNPLLFNDPYDCNIPINTNTSLIDIKNWLNSISVAPEFIDELADQLKNNPNIMKEKTENEMSQIGICCFSTLDDSILQWSHYSDYHKGICLKFNIAEDLEFFITPIVVSYRKLMKHYNHFIHSKDIVEYLIRPKFCEWSYESEIRIVKTTQNIKDNSGNRVFKFKDDALKEVIFGTKTPDDIITKYRRLCINKRNVHFYKMELGNGVHYELRKIAI